MIAEEYLTGADYSTIRRLDLARPSQLQYSELCFVRVRSRTHLESVLPRHLETMCRRFYLSTGGSMLGSSRGVTPPNVRLHIEVCSEFEIGAAISADAAYDQLAHV